MIQLFIGLYASALHVLAGPDHLAAVTPLAIENKKKSWSVGLFWGIGHVAGMLLIGLLFLTFKEFIPVETISTYSEQIVGVVLIAIGVWAIFKAISRQKAKPKHAHPHYHSEPEPHMHIHKHEHTDEYIHTHKHRKLIKQNNLSSLLIGTLHGFAGVSHFILLLPTLALPSVFDSVLYLSGFGIGTILAMVIYAFTIGLITYKSTENNKETIFKFFRLAGGIIAIVIGIFWIYQAMSA